MCLINVWEFLCLSVSVHLSFMFICASFYKIIIIKKNGGSLFLNTPHPQKATKWTTPTERWGLVSRVHLCPMKKAVLFFFLCRTRPSVSADGFARGTWPRFQWTPLCLTPLADYLCVGCNLPALSGRLAFCGSSAVDHPSPPCWRSNCSSIGCNSQDKQINPCSLYLVPLWTRKKVNPLRFARSTQFLAEICE